MPSSKDKKPKRVSRARNSKRTREDRPTAQAHTIQARTSDSRPVAAAGAPNPRTQSNDKYKFSEDYLNWLEVERGEMNQRQVNQVTERIFDSVLSKMGWARNEEGNLEHRGQ